MTTISLSGLARVEMSKSTLLNILKSFKGVKSYDDFGKEEYKVYTYGHKTIAAFDVNSKEVHINTNLIEV